MRLGTWTTIDCPTKNIDEAESFLTEKFGEIGGYVRKVSNSHDFGPYPSFEIDMPTKFEDIDEDFVDEDDEEEMALLNQKEEWTDKANQIESEYSEKFADYL